MPSGDTFYLDNFAIRQWDDPNYPGTRIDFDKAEFVAKVHEHYHAGSGLVDGYAPFCKHVFVPNFVGAKVGSVAITVDNQQSILTAYESRRPDELPVLARHVSDAAFHCHSDRWNPQIFCVLQQCIHVLLIPCVYVTALYLWLATISFGCAWVFVIPVATSGVDSCVLGP